MSFKSVKLSLGQLHFLTPRCTATFYMSGCYEMGEHNLRRYMKLAGDGNLDNNFNGTGLSRTRVIEALGSEEALIEYVQSQGVLGTLGGGSNNAASIIDDCQVCPSNCLCL